MGPHIVHFRPLANPSRIPEQTDPLLSLIHESIVRYTVLYPLNLIRIISPALRVVAVSLCIGIPMELVRAEHCVRWARIGHGVDNWWL